MWSKEFGNVTQVPSGTPGSFWSNEFGTVIREK